MERTLTAAERAIFLAEPRVALNIALAVRLGSEVPSAQLRDALRRLRQRYPLTGVRVAKDVRGRVTFSSRGTPEIPVQVVERCGPEDWQRVVSAELNEPFRAEDGPFVRAVLMRANGLRDLVLTFHQGIADGPSALLFLRDLLLLLDQPDVQLEELLTAPPLTELVPDSVQQNLVAHTGVLLAPLADWVGRTWWKVRPFKKKVREMAGLNVVSADLSETQTRVLFERCRHEKTTVHAAVCAALLRTIAWNRLGGRSWIRTVSSEVNLRGTLALGEAFGAVSTRLATTSFCFPDWNFWWTARSIKKRLDRKQRGAEAFAGAQRLEAVAASLGSRANSWMPTRFQRPTGADFSVSSLGQVILPPTDVLRIDGLHGPFFTPRKRERTVGTLVFNQRLTINFAFHNALLDPNVAAQLLERTIDELAFQTAWDETLKAYPGSSVSYS
jgi:hypothetical protein